MLNPALTIALTLLTLMVTVSGNPNLTYPTNPTAKYRCEFVNLNCIYTKLSWAQMPHSACSCIICVSLCSEISGHSSAVICRSLFFSTLVYFNSTRLRVICHRLWEWSQIGTILEPAKYKLAVSNNNNDTAAYRLPTSSVCWCQSSSSPVHNHQFVWILWSQYAKVVC